jgi:hypothetical protein
MSTAAPAGGHSPWSRPVPLILAALSLLLALEWLVSLQWRMVHDSPLNHYVAFLWQHHGLFPYRDVFEVQMPGTFLFHRAVGTLFGYGDLAFRWTDLAWLSAILWITWRVLRRFGREVAWVGVVLFGLSYFQHGPQMSLQKDYLGVLPIMGAVLLAASGTQRLGLRGFAVGALFGLAACFKPHLSLGLPVVLLFLLRSARPAQGAALRTVSLAGAGWALPVGGILLWVWWNGAWSPFREMLGSYLPLYLQLTVNHQTASGWGRVGYLFWQFKELGGQGLWLLPAGLALHRIVRDDKLPAATRRLAYLLAGMTLIYAVYPVAAGQFFQYHWMPFQFFVICLASLALMRPSGDAKSERWFPLAALGLAAFLSLHLPPDLPRQIRGLGPQPPKAGRADEIARFLQANLQPGDTVQPLDWTGGSVHGMLLAEARLATRFLYDYQFHHHVSRPEIQALRRRFLDEFVARPPRFVIDVTTGRASVWGEDTSYSFPELEVILQREYVALFRGDGYRILGRRPSEPTQRAP